MDDMKLPSPTEKKLLDEVTILWHNGSHIRARYLKKNGGDITNGTFYTLLRRLVEGGWVRTRKPKPKCSEDQRQRYYCTTNQTEELKEKMEALYEAMKPFTANDARRQTGKVTRKS